MNTLTTTNRKAKVDWLAAKHYYIENANISLRDVASKYDVTLKTVESHSSKEGWVKLRSQVGISATNKAIEQAVDERVIVVNEHAQKFAHIENISLAMMNRLAKKLKRLEQIDPDALLDDHRAYMSPQQWNYLVSAFKVATDGRRTALGLPNSITKSDNEINILNPYAGYPEQQLLQIINTNQAEMRAKYAREGVTD